MSGPVFFNISVGKHVAQVDYALPYGQASDWVLWDGCVFIPALALRAAGIPLDDSCGYLYDLNRYG